MELVRIFDVVVRRLTLILVTVGASLVTAVVVDRVLPATYSASALLHVPTAPVGSDWRQYDLDYADRLMNTYVNLAATARVERAVADELGLQRVPHLAVEVEPNTELMRTVGRGPTPLAAARAANALAEVLIELGSELATQLAPGAAPPAPQVVEAASPPIAPRGVGLALALVLAAVAGLGLGLVLAFVVENLDSRVFDVDMVAYLTGLPVIATVPRFGRRGRGGIAAGDSRAARAYRSLRAQLTARNGGAPLGALLVVGTERGDGASTTVANLAKTLANIGRRVVVIDCDTAAPTQQSLLGVKGRTKLSIKAKRSDGARKYALTTTIDGVRMVEARPSEVAGLLGELTLQVDSVLIDARPLSESGDALFIASQVDGVALTVRRGAVRSASLVEARDQLRTVRTRQFGVIVTHARRVRDRMDEPPEAEHEPRSRLDDAHVAQAEHHPREA